MAVTIPTLEDLQSIKTELIDEMRRLIGNTVPASPGKWLKSHQVRRLLAISPGTLQHMRVTGVLPFTKIGGVIYYEYEDIREMMETRKSTAVQPTQSKIVGTFPGKYR